MVTLVEQHVIKANDPRFAEIDAAAFAAKNLYNLGNYTIRQSWLSGDSYIPYARLYHVLKETEAYCALPRKVSQLVLRQLDHNWRAFFAALRAWREHPGRFLGRPRPPGYKHKQKGRFLLTYNQQAISRRWLRKGFVKPSQLDVFIQTQQTNVRQVRIVPRRDHYVVEIVYERAPEQHDLDEDLVAGIDLGIDNLITLTSNQPGFTPVVVNGRGLKSINQYYNKRRAELQAQVGTRSTKRLRRLAEKRNRQIKHLLHIASRRVIDHLVMRGIGTLVIGYNPNWKQRVNIGRVNNQKFVSIPHAMLLDMLTYKAELAGILVVLQEESYTSKCSFLDGEFPEKQAVYAGKRIKRGLFQTADGHLINADVNGAYNIITKAFPKAIEGIEGVVVHPVRVMLSQTE
ncbi:transposase [bacterium]|nr:transposase [bacterium]